MLYIAHPKLHFAGIVEADGREVVESEGRRFRSDALTLSNDSVERTGEPHPGNGEVSLEPQPRANGVRRDEQNASFCGFDGALSVAVIRVHAAEFQTGKSFKTAVTLTCKVAARPLYGVKRTLPLSTNPSRFTIQKAESGISIDHFRGQSLEPFVDKSESTGRNDVLTVLRDQTSGLALKSGSEVVMDRLGPLLGGLEVGGGVNVQPYDLGLRPLHVEATLKEVPEEVVIAIAMLVQSVREQPTVLQSGELLLPVVDASQALGDLWGDLLEDRCREEEVARLLRLLVENFLSEEVEQVAVRGGRDRLNEDASLLRRGSLA